MRTFAPYHQYHNFLDCEEEQALLDYAFDKESWFEVSTLQGGVVDEGRRRSQRLTEVGLPGEHFERRIRACAPDFFARIGTPPFEIEYVELEIAAHGDGAHFAAHTDIPFGWGRSPLGGDKSGTQDRIISLVYYFYREPQGFDGGELWLHRFGSKREAFIVSKKILKTITGAALGVALCLSSTVASAAAVPLAPMSISPFVALSAYGTMQSRSAVCATAVGAAGVSAAVEGQPAVGCVLPVLDPAAPVVVQNAPPPMFTPVASSGFGFGIGALLAGLVAVAGLAAVLLSNGDDNDRLPISPD